MALTSLNFLKNSKLHGSQRSMLKEDTKQFSAFQERLRDWVEDLPGFKINTDCSFEAASHCSVKIFRPIDGGGCFHGGGHDRKSVMES